MVYVPGAREAQDYTLRCRRGHIDGREARCDAGLDLADRIAARDAKVNL